MIKWIKGMEATERNGYHHMLVTQGRKKKTCVNHEKCIGVCGAWPAWNKHVGTSGLVTVYNNTTEHKVTI